MRPVDNRVVVVGAGVIGLSCAVLLAEAGYDTNVLARELPLETFSAHGAGLWLPQVVAPTHKLFRWAGQSYHALREIADDPRAGVRLAEGVVLAAGTGPAPSWRSLLPEGVALTQITDPAPGHRTGWRLRVPVIDMPRYLGWLAARLDRAGGILTRMPLTALPTRGLVINCTGVAARALARDWAVHPVRGQVAVVDNPGLTTWFLGEDEAGPVYALPQGDQVLVGGSAELDEWDTTIDPAIGERLVQRAAVLEPSLAGASVRAHRCGLRPAREEVRLEVVTGGRAAPERVLVHCYGHGDLGATLAWGCAREVLTRVEQLEPTLF